jgi:beta-glucosidase
MKKRKFVAIMLCALVLVAIGIVIGGYYFGWLRNAPAAISAVASPQKPPDIELPADFSPEMFPEGFIWGVATSGYQINPNSPKSDWILWDKNLSSQLKQYGEVPDAYHVEKRYLRDIAEAKKMGVKMIRISVDWSLLEPEKGKWNDTEFGHLRDYVVALKAAGIEPMICLWHFVEPVWRDTKYRRWLDPRSVGDFERLAEEVATRLGKPLGIRYWMTMNEPQVVIGEGYWQGNFPPGVHGNIDTARMVAWHMALAHKAAYRTIHRICDGPGFETIVGIAHATNDYIPASENSMDIAVAQGAHFIFNDYFYQVTADQQDYIGINYYRRYAMNRATGWGKEQITPDGLYSLIKKFSMYGKPMIVTENGVNTDDESFRVKFIAAHVNAIHKAISEGMDVRGYFIWSLTDTYEWLKGFETKFGLIDIDLNTQERVWRQSAYFYRDLIRANTLTTDLLQKYSK